VARYLILAAGSDIGQGLCQHLLFKGHELITTARDGRYIQADHGLDLTDFTAVKDLFAKIGKIDGVVNCAGSLLLKPAHLTSFDDYMATVHASLTTSFAVVAAAGQHLQQSSIVLISSAAAEIGLANHEAIAAAKAGIIGLARSAAATYANRGLRFNVVAPGLVDTKLTHGLLSNDVFKKASEAMHPLGRVGQVNDIVQAISFFLSEESQWVTGQVLAVDGGLSSIKPRAKL
jgi:NAD(P)-dependent dehydrogenase (short-subunit alcohol dehydrogenase family)